MFHVYANVSSFNGVYRIVRTGERTKKTSKGYKGNNPYDSFFARASGKVYPRGTGKSEMVADEPLVTAARPSVSDNNRLYSKLVEKLNGGDQGDLLTSAVEWRSSLDMITSRAKQLGEIYLTIRRGDFGKAASLMGLVSHRRKSVEKRLKKRRRLDATEVWLEYWMGWAPMIGDIGNALEVIIRPPPLNQGFSVSVKVSSKYVNTIGIPSDRTYRVEKCDLNGRLSAYGKYKIVNHNLNTLNQLGLINPARTAWNVVPFSFIVDWFSNVGQVLGSLTDFAGLSISDTGRGYLFEHTSSKIGHDWLQPSALSDPMRIPFSANASSVDKRRVPGSLPSPQLNVVMLDKLSLTRAATSISLLVEIFLKK